MSQTNANGIPRLILKDKNETLTNLLLEGQRLLVRYPQASRAIVQAFMAEGRRFSETEEGQEWQAALAKSNLIRRGRHIWDAYSLDALLENESNRLPSAWLDIITAAVSNPDLETILSTLVVEEVRNGIFGSSQHDKPV